jgi:hypothetical protein
MGFALSRTDRVEDPIDRVSAQGLRKELTDPRHRVLPLGAGGLGGEPLLASRFAVVPDPPTSRSK